MKLVCFLRNLYKILFSLLFLLFFVGKSYAAEQPVRPGLKLVTPSWKSFTNQDGTGLYFEIIRAVYAPLGIKVEYEFVPWKRALKMVEAEVADAVMGVSQVASKRLQPKKPLVTLETATVFKRRRKWKGRESFRGKRVVTIRGYNFRYYPWFQSLNIDWHEVNTVAHAWKDLRLNKIDYYVDVLIDLEQFVQEHRMDLQEWRIEVLYEEPLFINFSNTENSKKLIKIYDQRITQLARSGKLKAIFKRWGVKYPNNDNWFR